MLASLASYILESRVEARLLLLVARGSTTRQRLADVR
jgi:hypothetical protein